MNLPFMTRFYVDNFKGLRDFTIHFSEPFSVIAGPNGAGKTSICQALELMFRLVRERPADVVQGLDAALIKNKWSSTSKIVLEADFGISCPEKDPATITWHVEIAKKNGWGIANESVRRKDADIPESTVGEVLKRKWRKIRVFNRRKNKWEEETKELPSYLSTVSDETKDDYPELYDLQKSLVFRYVPFLNPVFLRRRTRESELGSQGENFASYLHQFAQSHRSDFEKVTERLADFFTTLQSLRTIRSKFGWTEVQVVQRFQPGVEMNFRADQVNDGLLRLAAIATLPYAEEGLKVVAIEEPENGMHPRLLERTVELLRGFRELGVQVIATTHSSVLLNFVQPEEAIILRHRGVEGPEARRFTDLKAGMKRLAYFDIGDVLYEVGEEKLLGRK